MDTYIGLDFGGTKLLIGEMDKEGNILCKKQYTTGYSSQRDAVKGIFENLQDYKRTVGFQGNIRAAGMGIVGIVDCDQGLWISINHEREGQPVPLARLLEKELMVPCGVNNDVRSATTAELMLGQGKYSRNFVYLNVGTGLAAGFVSDGKIIRGANYNAGEVGHMSVDLHNAAPCICGRSGCVENVVSGTGFTQQIRTYGRKDLLNEKGRADVFALFEGARDGEQDCREIVEYAADSLACVIMNLVRVTDPDTVILGGGICNDDWFMSLVRQRLHPGTMRGVTRGVVKSSFSVKLAGLIGAASLGMLLDEKGRNRKDEDHDYARRKAI